jgi:hypothetical protein
MKHFISFCLLSLAIFIAGSIHGCKKEYIAPTYPAPVTNIPPTPPDTLVTVPITSSYTEEFGDFTVMQKMGWYTAEYSPVDTLGTTGWSYGQYGGNKYDTTFYGFYAFSYSFPFYEFAYSYAPAADNKFSISSWLISPILVVKDGDTISFYTRGDTTGVYTDRMQVLMDTLGSVNVGHELTSVGAYTSMLFDINPSQAPGAYPTIWTKYEYVFSGFTGTKNIRIGFRHYVIQPNNARGIGIDLFKFRMQ